MPFVISLLGILVLAAGVAGGWWFFGRPLEEHIPTPPVLESRREQESQENKKQYRFRNASYTQKEPYTSPGGQDELIVSLTLEEDIVKSIAVEGVASNETSQKFQKDFQDGFTSLIVGRPLDEINIAVINGASLTSAAFEKALEKIQNQAKITSDKS